MWMQERVWEYQRIMTGNDRSNKNTKMCRSKWADLEMTQIKYLWGQTGNIKGEEDPVYYRREEDTWKLERNVLLSGEVVFAQLQWLPCENGDSLLWNVTIFEEKLGIKIVCENLMICKIISTN